MIGYEELKQRQALAAGVLASVADLRPDALAALAEALGFAGPPLAWIGQALDSFALGSPDLAVLQMGYALRKTVAHPDYPRLSERLEGAEGAPWAQLLDALETTLTTTKEQEASNG